MSGITAALLGVAEAVTSGRRGGGRHAGCGRRTFSLTFWGEDPKFPHTLAMDPALDPPRSPSHPKHPRSTLEIGEEAGIRRVTRGTDEDMDGAVFIYVHFI